jgi:hypothetical protein
VSFATPVLGAGLFIIDYFNPIGDNPLTIQAFTGSNGTGTSLGSFSSVAFNFQNNNLYFMGITSDQENIGSIVFTDINTNTGDTIGIDNIMFSRSLPSNDPVPEPSTWLLMGTGLVGMLGYGWRRQRQQHS